MISFFVLSLWDLVRLHGNDLGLCWWLILPKCLWLRRLWLWLRWNHSIIVWIRHECLVRLSVFSSNSDLAVILQIMHHSTSFPSICWEFFKFLSPFFCDMNGFVLLFFGSDNFSDFLGFSNELLKVLWMNSCQDREEIISYKMIYQWWNFLI